MLLHPSAILPTRDPAALPAALLERLGKPQSWETALSDFPPSAHPFGVRPLARLPSSPHPFLIYPKPQALTFNYEYWMTINPDFGLFDGPILLQCRPQIGILSASPLVSFHSFS